MVYARDWLIIKIGLETLMISFPFETVNGYVARKKDII
jgi:hypothetical protein